MKKRIFIGHWFYILGGIIMIVLCSSVTIVTTVALITTPKEVNPTVTTLYWVVPLLFLITIFMIFAAGYWMFQFTVVTETGIKVRCVWRIIRKLKWEEVKEVRLEKFYISVQGGVTSKWYVIDDGKKRFIKNGIMHKNSHITLPYSKKAEKALKEFWKGEIIEKTIR